MNRRTVPCQAWPNTWPSRVCIRSPGAPRGQLDPRRLQLDAELRTITGYVEPALPYLAPVFGQGHGSSPIPASSAAAMVITLKVEPGS